MDVFLETERLVLRRFSADDAGLIVEINADPHVRRYVQLHPTTAKEAADEVLPRWLRYYDRYRGYGHFAAIERSSGEFIGWFHLRPGLTDGADDEPELGYRLRRQSWGRGYATEGARALIDRAFADLRVRRVWAEAMAVHGASRRVMEKAGLRFIGPVQHDWPDRIPGDEHGDVQYAITRDEWERDRSASRTNDAP